MNARPCCLAWSAGNRPHAPRPFGYSCTRTGTSDLAKRVAPSPLLRMVDPNASPRHATVRACYEFGRAIERSSDLRDTRRFLQMLRVLPDRPELGELKERATRLETIEDPAVLVSFIAPLERLLDRSVRDDDLLVRDVDDPNVERRVIPVHLVLENVRSAFNIGSILRTADALGAASISLCGYTAGPDNPMVRKTALGAEEIVPVHVAIDPLEEIERLRAEGCRIVALETSDRAEPLGTWGSRESLALLLGNERHGLSARLLQAADQIWELPSFGVKNSINVAVAAGIALHEARRLHRPAD